MHVFFILLQVLWILTGERVWTDGDMTLETVNTFLKENSIYTVDPLTGEPYTQGMSFRLKLLCLPTLYGAISRWSGMAPETVVYRLIPCLTLCMGYLAYGRLGAVLFDHNREKCNIFLIIVGILFCAGTYMPGVDGFDIFYGAASLSVFMPVREKISRCGALYPGGSLYGLDTVRRGSVPARDGGMGGITVAVDNVQPQRS